MSNEHSESEASNSAQDSFRPLNDQEEDWLDENHRAEFLNSIGRKGKVSGSAAEYTRETIVPAFFAEWYPNSTEGEQTEMFDEAESKIYMYLINTKRPGSGKRKKKRAKSARVDVTNIWADDNPATKEKILDKYRKKNNLAPTASVSVDIQRKLICEAFRKLPKDVQTEYEDRAAEMREELTKSKVLQGDERVEYAQSVPGLLKNFIREVELQGVLITANVAYQVEDGGTLEVTSVGSDLAKGYKETDGHADAVATFVEWLRSQGKRVKRDIPIELPYPDRKNESMPLIPEIDYDSPPPVPTLRRIVRIACSALNQRLGGSPHLAWTEMQLAQVKGDFSFVDRERMPPDYPLIDPRFMNREYALTWVKWLARPQKGEGDPRTWFIPRLVFTTSTKSLPAQRNAVSERKVMRGKSEVWELTYDRWVEKCQVNGKITYPDNSRDYKEFLKKCERDRTSRPHLQGLPCDSNYVPTPAFSDEDLDFIRKLIQPLPDADKDAITGILVATNDMYSQRPVETDGVFDPSEGSLKHSVGHPSLLPDTLSKLLKTTDLVSTWVPSAYFAPPFDEVPASATISFFEKWQHWALHKGYLKHPESETLQAGLGGASCVVLAILKLLFSIGAVLGKLQLPDPRPKDIQDPRVTESDWERCLAWCKQWQSSIEDSTEILRKTFSECTSQAEPAKEPLKTVKASTHAKSNNTNAEAGPSQPPEQIRTRPRLAYHTPAADDPDDAPVSSSSDEGDRSDNYQDPGGDADSEGDVGSEGEKSGSEGKVKLSKKARGKLTARTAQATGQVPSIEQSRTQYEADQVLPEGAKGPIPDVPLTTHPLGGLLPPRNTSDWSGTAFQVIEQCRKVETEVAGALSAWHNSSTKTFRPEDITLAITETISASVPDDLKPAFLLLAIQRKVWDRTKDMWPTVQYQYRLFSELTRSASCFFATAYDLQKSAPETVVKNLKGRLVVLKRLAYQARFVYHERHDLGMVSKAGFSDLPISWSDSSAADLLGSNELATAAEKIRQWSTNAENIVKYHAESRAKTWEHIGVDTKKYRVPAASWFAFGNPPSCAELDKAQVELKVRMTAVRESNPEPQGHEEPDMDIDSVSPSEEERRAQALLDGGKDISDGSGNQTGGGGGETAMQLDGEKKKGTRAGANAVIVAIPVRTKGPRNGTKKPGDAGTDNHAKTKSTPAPKASSSKKRKSKQETADPNQSEDEPPKKKPPTATTKGAQAKRDSVGGGEGQVTRSGRTVKVSARAQGA